MLLTLVTGSDRARKLYATRCASVVCYFSETDDGGVVLNIQQGSGTWPSVYEAVVDDVRAEVLAMVALRLKVPTTEVLNSSFKDLMEVADPDLPPEYRFARPSNRAYPRRFD